MKSSLCRNIALLAATSFATIALAQSPGTPSSPSSPGVSPPTNQTMPTPPYPMTPSTRTPTAPLSNPSTNTLPSDRLNTTVENQRIQALNDCAKQPAGAQAGCRADANARYGLNTSAQQNPAANPDPMMEPLGGSANDQTK